MKRHLLALLIAAGCTGSPPPTEPASAEAPSDTPTPPAVTTKEQTSSEPVAVEPGPSEAPKVQTEDAQAKLMAKADRGEASEAELRQLKALCMLNADRACRAKATAMLKALRASK